MSPFDEHGKVWMNGRLIRWNEAHIHIASHVIHYGSSLFEGFRAYETPQGTAVFRLDAHIKRLYDSCKMYRMDVPYTREEFSQAVIETVRANGYKSCYIRPIIYRGYHSLGVDPFPNPVDCAILVWNWGQYLGEEALENGVDVKISTWWRMAPNTFPALAKSGANYMNSQLIKMEALVEGYAEGIALNVRGHISEGSGENIFLVHNGTVSTPPLSSSILPGITRDSVITLLKGMGIRLVEETIPRAIRSIDKIAIGTGKRGPVVKRLQEAFFAYLNGEREDAHHWLTYI
jgi:branched-chain amino acid aminotransferase